MRIRRHIIALLLVATWLFAFSHDGLEQAGLAPAHHLHLGHHHYGHEHPSGTDPHPDEANEDQDAAHAPLAARGSHPEVRAAMPALWLLVLLPLALAPLALLHLAASTGLRPTAWGWSRIGPARLNLWLFEWRCAPDAIAPPAAA